MSTSGNLSPSSIGGSSGVLGRLKTGFKLTVDSIGVIRSHPKLLTLPLLGGASAVFFWILFLLPLFVAELLGSGLIVVVLFMLYFVTTFFASLFTAALVFAVNQVFHDEEPDIKESIRAAWQRKGPILAWSAIAAVVSLLLKWLEQQDNTLSSVANMVFGIAWSVTTFFIIPVIVFEDVTVKTMFTRSAETFKDTWGESIGVGFGVAIIQFAVAAVGILIAAGAFLVFGALFPALGIVLGVVLFGAALLAAYLVGQTIWAVTKTALYVYAAEDRIPDEFADFDFETMDGRTEQKARTGKVSSPNTHLSD